MGSGSWDHKSYRAFSDTVSSKSVNEVYSSRTMKTSAGYAKTGLSPKNVPIRESRDSADHPNSTALIVALDVTGSMGHIADIMAKESLGVLFNEILSRKPISDPQIMFMGVGDANFDTAPLQVSQFESDNKIVEQLTDLWLEHGGGGNHFESYNLPWYFAAMHTSIDCFEKRGKKGYLFTIGDEEAPQPLSRDHIEKFIGDTPQNILTNADLLTMVGRMYHVFHIMVGEGSHARSYSKMVRKSWTDALGQRALWLADHTKISEVIVSTIQINEGADKDAVADSWDGSTSMVVRDAVGGLTKIGERGGTDVVAL